MEVLDSYANVQIKLSKKNNYIMGPYFTVQGAVEPIVCLYDTGARLSVW